MLSRKPSGSVFSFLSFLSLFLVLSLSFRIIKVPALLPTTLPSPLVPNTSIFVTISFATIFPMVLFVPIGYQLPTCPPIFLQNPYLILHSLNIALHLDLLLFDFLFYFFCFSIFSILFRSLLMGVC